MKKRLFPEIKKELKNFVKDESGIISKENILKAGIAIGGALALAQSALAHQVELSRSHTNTITMQPIAGGGDSSDHTSASHTHNVHVVYGC